MVCVHPRPFLKPNWLSPVFRVYWNLSKKQYSKILLKMGVMAIPLKSSYDIALVRVSFSLGMGTM